MITAIGFLFDCAIQSVVQQMTFFFKYKTRIKLSMLESQWSNDRLLSHNKRLPFPFRTNHART